MLWYAFEVELTLKMNFCNNFVLFNFCKKSLFFVKCRLSFFEEVKFKISLKVNAPLHWRFKWYLVQLNKMNICRNISQKPSLFILIGQTLQGLVPSWKLVREKNLFKNLFCQPYFDENYFRNFTVLQFLRRVIAQFRRLIHKELKQGCSTWKISQTAVAGLETSRGPHCKFWRDF